VNVDALFWIMIFAALLSCLAAVGARSLREYSLHDLEELCLRSSRPGRLGDIIHHDEQVALGAEHAGVLTGAVFAVSSTCWAWGEWSSAPSQSVAAVVALVSAGVGLVITASQVWIPWSVSRLAATGVVYHTWPIWRALYQAMTPLVWCARAIDRLFHRLAGRTYQEENGESFEDEIRTIVSEGHREGLLEEDARDMIESVIELGDAEVSEIMTPRTDMHMVHVNLPWDELLTDVIISGHTRVPAYDKNRDDIVGILYSKDLLPELAKGPGKPRRPLVEPLRKPLFVPETKAVPDLLQMFQQTHTHLAVVLDEYGGVSGLVTIEDVLEEIVGEIVDEYDADVEQEVRRLTTKPARPWAELTSTRSTS
jgi:CBS domain containing-hemolysin-like protein